MVIYLSEHRAAKAAPAGMLKNRAYADETMHNCNPAVIYRFSAVAQGATRSELPEDPSKVEVDAFLERVYVLATQS